MMKKLLNTLLQIIAVAILVGCSTLPSETQVPASTSAPCSGQAITIGDISDDPDEVISSNLPLANYLAKHLEQFGYDCGKVTVVDTVDEMITAIKDGEVDIYMDSMYPATLVSNATGALPVLRRWRNCDPDYLSVIFAASNSGITSIDDLPGKMIGMDRSYSTSGFALPASYLLDHGLDLVVKDSYSDPVGVNVAGIFYSLDDKNTLNLVLEDKVSAGVTDDYFFNKWQEEAPGKLVKLAETESVPRQAVLIRSDLAPETREEIKSVLSQAHLNPQGLSVLEQSAQTCKFDDTPGGIEAIFDQMQLMHTRLQQIPGWLEAFQQGR
jgi:phosphonate transport system substrate-binding protein